MAARGGSRKPRVHIFNHNEVEEMDCKLSKAVRSQSLSLEAYFIWQGATS